MISVSGQIQGKAAAFLTVLASIMLSTFARADNASCSIRPTTRDRESGIQILSDPACARTSGVGCINAVCRYCRLRETDTAFENLLSCAQVLGFISPTPAAAPATDEQFPPAIIVLRPDHLYSDDAQRTGSDAAPYMSRDDDVDADQAFPVMLEHLPDPVEGSSGDGATPALQLDCLFRVAIAEDTLPMQPPEIDVITDIACMDEVAIGCFTDVCRLCRRPRREALTSAPRASTLLLCDTISINNGNDVGFRPIEQSPS